MPSKRFFLPASRSEDLMKLDEIEVGPDMYNHMIKSMRMQKGDCCLLLDGRGHQGKVRIEEIDRDRESAVLKVINTEDAAGEPDTEIFIAQALAKKKKVETVIQKSTEIGARGFYPFSSRHAVVKLKADRVDKRLDRWRKIIREAARQSERGIRPDIFRPIDLDGLMDLSRDFEVVLLARAREARHTIKELSREKVVRKGRKILLIIGPEGGLAEKEIEKLISLKNCYDISLGPRILRTETAGPVLSGIILHEVGEMQ
ncbi:16S rRNA (uracil1498-N3)-methyltransferase [Halarsenatibacter silvermanii]|uniref:Ribosomal RNA small subunit methyltransferase E n=1 Tax=Halarsenatibacter silvermanii TaxID=321763 RepID=A0A1G9JWY2_9FIRM|nr:16S rRNA (uracil1498-N3)-methyltransferase [Halarsenatibacter silvermanii]